MTSEIFVRIVLSIITIIGALVSAYVVPYLKIRVTDQQIKQLNYYVSIAVRCAEQIYTPEQWKIKKAYVMDYVTDMAEIIGIKLSQDQIDTIVEGVVNEIKQIKE